MKYATAINPESTNATGRVNSPTKSQRPAEELEHAGQSEQRHELQADASRAHAGNPRSFWLP